MTGGGDDLKLLGIRGSPHVLRVRLALRLKGLSYDYVEQDPMNNHKIDDLLCHGKVPVLLIHGAKPVRGSRNIIQYVDEASPNSTGHSLLPVGSHDRAIARYWADFIDDMLIEAMYKAAWGEMEGENAEGKNHAASAVEALEGALRECSKPFFGGNNAGYVDVVLGSLLPFVHAVDAMHGTKNFGPTTTPLLATWKDCFGTLDEARWAVDHAGHGEASRLCHDDACSPHGQPKATWGTKTFDPTTTPLLATWTDRFGEVDAAHGGMPNMGKQVGFGMRARHPGRSSVMPYVYLAIMYVLIILIVYITWTAL